MTSSDVAEYFERMVSDEAWGEHTWEKWAEISDFIEEIDFDCQFDDNGKCGRLGLDRGCCGACADWRGYLDVIPIEALETVKREFDKDDGFWRPEGCALPRKWRSITCQTHRCSDYHTPAWNALDDLVWSYDDITISQVRALMQEEGRLREPQLVTIGGF